MKVLEYAEKLKKRVDPVFLIPLSDMNIPRNSHCERYSNGQ